jgi:hypothetical protein
MTILVDTVTLQPVEVPIATVNTYLAKGWVYPNHPTVAALFLPSEAPTTKSKVGLEINSCSTKALEQMIGNLAIAKRAVAGRPYADISDLQNKIPDFAWDAYQNSFDFD